MNKRYSGRQLYIYRPWLGPRRRMCQFGAFGLAKMGVKYDEIIKHYFTRASNYEVVPDSRRLIVPEFLSSRTSRRIKRSLPQDLISPKYQVSITGRDDPIRHACRSILPAVRRGIFVDIFCVKKVV